MPEVYRTIFDDIRKAKVVSSYRYCGNIRLLGFVHSLTWRLILVIVSPEQTLFWKLALGFAVN
jgi:hypothetical protein